MNRPLGIALVVVGIVLLVMANRATDSISSDFSRFFTGSPTNKSIWLLIGGLASVIAGSFITLRSVSR